VAARGMSNPATIFPHNDIARSGSMIERKGLEEDLTGLREKNQEIIDKCDTIQKGVTTVRSIAESNNDVFSWIENNILPNFDFFVNNPQIRPILQNLTSALDLTCHMYIDTAMTNLKFADAEVNQAASGVSVFLSTLATPCTEVYSWAVLDASAGTLSPHPLKPLVYDTSHVQQRLASSLLALDTSGKLVKRRSGAWDAFHSSSVDGLSQACHSMREVLTVLLDRHAPNNKVIEAAWWSSNKQAKDGVTKRHKIAYLIFGKDVSSIDSNLLDQIQQDIDSCKALHDKLCAVAHLKEERKEAVKGYLNSMEALLVRILEHKKVLIASKEY